MNIDKDIEKVKEMLEDFGFEEETGDFLNWAKRITTDEMKAIKNVLSELEKKDKIIKTDDMMLKEDGIDKIKQATHNTEVVSNAITEQMNLHEKLKAEGKNPEYILIYSNGYAQGEYDTKVKLEKELDTWKKIAEKLAELLDNQTNFGDYIEEFRKKEECYGCDGKHCKQCIIDWARKEVESEKNNSNN